MKQECDKFRNRIATALRGELAGDELAALKAHLKECAGCRAYLADLKRIDRIIGSYPQAEVSDGVWDRLQERIHARRRSFTFRVVAIAAAAAVVLVALALVLFTGSSPKSTVVKRAIPKVTGIPAPPEPREAPKPEKPLVVKKEAGDRDINKPAPEREARVKKEEPVPEEIIVDEPEVPRPPVPVKEQPERKEPEPEQPVKKEVVETPPEPPKKQHEAEVPPEPPVQAPEEEEGILLTLSALDGAVYMSAGGEKPKKAAQGAEAAFGSTVSTKYSGKARISMPDGFLVALNVNTEVELKEETDDSIVLCLRKGEIFCACGGLDKPLVIETAAGDFSASDGVFSLHVKGRERVYVSAVKGEVTFSGIDEEEIPPLSRAMYAKGKRVKRYKWIPLAKHLKWGAKVIPGRFFRLDRSKDDKNDKPGPHSPGPGVPPNAGGNKPGGGDTSGGRNRPGGGQGGNSGGRGNNSGGRRR
jgi:ferric-dicitrate binding protein FerR (iron transport regulator)